MDILSKLQPPAGAVRSKTRKGRGPGSGIGKNAGKGVKGQTKRAGGNINKVHFQGGQTPLQRRLPKRGFRNPLAPKVVAINVSALEVFDAGTEVTLEALQARRLVQGRFDFVKVLGDGDLSKSLQVSAHRFSKSAISKIEAAGGKAIELPKPTRKVASEDAAS